LKSLYPKGLLGARESGFAISKEIDNPALAIAGSAWIPRYNRDAEAVWQLHEPDSMGSETYSSILVQVGGAEYTRRYMRWFMIVAIIFLTAAVLVLWLRVKQLEDAAKPQIRPIASSQLRQSLRSPRHDRRDPTTRISGIIPKVVS
jgi:hypothetical protein